MTRLSGAFSARCSLWCYKWLHSSQWGIKPRLPGFVEP